jgi:hypothetical protein
LSAAQGEMSRHNTETGHELREFYEWGRMTSWYSCNLLQDPEEAMMKAENDHIVLGVGGSGSGALYWLSRRAGQDVLGLEQFELFHSRIIGLTYNHRDYTRLVPHTFSTWATVEEESAVRVVVKAGLLHFAPTSSVWRREIDLYTAAMDECGL